MFLTSEEPKVEYNMDTEVTDWLMAVRTIIRETQRVESTVDSMTFELGLFYRNR